MTSTSKDLEKIIIESPWITTFNIKSDDEYLLSSLSNFDIKLTHNTDNTLTCNLPESTLNLDMKFDCDFLNLIIRARKDGLRKIMKKILENLFIMNESADLEDKDISLDLNKILGYIPNEAMYNLLKNFIKKGKISMNDTYQENGIYQFY